MNQRYQQDLHGLQATLTSYTKIGARAVRESRYNHRKADSSPRLTPDTVRHSQQVASDPKLHNLLMCQ